MVVQETQSDAPEALATERPRSRNVVAIIAGAAVVVFLIAIGVYYVAFRSLPTTVSWAPSVSAIPPGGELTVLGKVTPAQSGREVSFESAPIASGPWQPMPEYATTDSRGRFTTTIKPQLTRSIVMRVVVDPAGRYLAVTGVSQPLRLLTLLDAVTVGGTTKAPTLILNTKPLKVKTTITKIIEPGTGPALTKANAITFNYVLVNGTDGKKVESSFDAGKQPPGLDLSSASLLPGLSKGLSGQKVGAKLLVAIPPVDAFGAQGNVAAGFGPTDTVLFYMELISASTTLETATGAEVPPMAGLPTATVDGAKAAVITVPKTAPPTKLVVQPLIKGAGPVVKSGQKIKVNYTGVLWKDGTKFDASGDRGEPVDFPIGTGGVIPGWDKGLVGQTVGSRMLLVVPPADGYGAKGKPPTIGPEDTLVFVVDILGSI